MNQGGGTSIKMSSTAVKGQMKGLLKGLRYISQMFDEEEEKEIQIGFPTDVKHLAHIGCEDEKTNKPSWMTEFKETQQPSTGAKISEDSGNNSDTNSAKGEGKRSHVRRSRQRSSESQSSTNSSPPREEGGSTKPSRRHRQSRQSNEDEENNKPPTTKQSHRRKTKSSSEEKDKETSSTRKPARTRRSSKADSLTDDDSFTDLGPGPGPGSGPSAQ